MDSKVFQSRHLQEAVRDDNGNVVIRFVNGAIYHYTKVPEDVYDNLCQMSSPGTYFNAKISGNYGEKRLQAGMKKGRRR